MAINSVFFLFLAGFLSAENLKITVYHTNDIHGWIMSRPAAFYAADPKRPIGGAAVLSNLLKQEKGPKLLLDAGDWFQGTPEGNVTEGRAAVDVLNALGYDAVAVGNHDYDYGQAKLEGLVKSLRMPALAANIYLKDGRRPSYLKPWVVREVAGVKVGIFGLLTVNTVHMLFPETIEGLVFRREVDEAKKAVKALKDLGATVIIAVTHMGFEAPDYGRFEGDQTLASEVEGIDLIVGGHNHIFVREPVLDATHNTLITQAGSALSAVGKVVLEVDSRTKRVVRSSGTLLDLWVDEIGEDPGMLKVIRRYQEDISRLYDVAVASAAVTLARDVHGESSLGNWVTDCLRGWTATDVALQNGAGIRSDMPQGAVTLRTLFNIMPFDNYVTKLTMKGRVLEAVLDHGVGKNKGIVQVSGASFSYDRDKSAGSRLADVKIGGKPLDPEATYTVSTIDFLVRGGDGFRPLAQAETKEFTRVLLRDVLLSCAKKESPIREPAGGRMKKGL